MLAGVLSVLSMAPFFLWPVLLVTLPVLVWLIDGAAVQGTERAAGLRADLWGAFQAGWWFGFGYFVAGLFWIGEAFLVEAEIFAWLLPFAVTLMPAGLALFYGAAAAAARAMWRSGFPRILLLAAALGAAEWLRGHVLTGFPWNVIGYALTPTLPLMQSAGLIGIYGLTLFTVLVCAGPLVLGADWGRAGRPAAGLMAGFLVFCVPLMAALGYGHWRLASSPAPPYEGARVRIVQPSVPQRDKWRRDKQQEIFLDHLWLSRRTASGDVDDLRGITHLVWPEAAMPFLPLSTPDALAAIGDLLPDGVHLLTGALRVERPLPASEVTPVPPRAFNSLMVFDDNGKLTALYDKIHLVPFGEYLPLQSALEGIGLQQLTRMRGGFTAGRVPRPLLSVPGLPLVGGLICYEAIFPRAVVQGRERPGLLVNLTNDGWFGNTTGPQQHFHQARVRAVEEGLPLIRAANNGISALIDAEGRVVDRLELNQRGVIDATLPGSRPPTLYSRLGDLPFALMALVFLSLGLAAPRNRL